MLRRGWWLRWSSLRVCSDQAVRRLRASGRMAYHRDAGYRDWIERPDSRPDVMVGLFGAPQRSFTSGFAGLIGLGRTSGDQPASWSPCHASAPSRTAR
jgi:hypothetical protein